MYLMKKNSNIIHLANGVMGYVRSLNGHDFTEWWNKVKDRIDWKESSNILCEYVPHRFDIWFDPEKFNWKDATKELMANCQNYKHIWEKDYLVWKLQQKD